jgi:hypothetical protein
MLICDLISDILTVSSSSVDKPGNQTRVLGKLLVVGLHVAEVSKRKTCQLWDQERDDSTIASWRCV